MRASINVTNRKEADNIRRGLANSDVRAFVVTIGALSKLPSERAKMRVAQFVQNYFVERDENQLNNQNP